MADIRITESGWRGLDESIAPELLAQGFLSRADHVIIDAGEVRLRPGLVNQLTSALPNAAWVLGAASDGTGDYLLIASNEKIRRWEWAANSTSQPSGQSVLSVTPANVQAAQGFGMFWLVDGTNGPRSYNGSTVASLTSLDAPAAPGVELSHVLLLNLPSLTWTQNTITGSLTEPTTSGQGDTLAPMSSIRRNDGDFWDAGSTGGLAFWNTRAGAPAYSPNVQDGNARNAVELDSDTGVGDSVISDPILLNAATASGYARVAVLSYEAAGEDATTNTMQVEADVTVFSDTGGTTAITGSTKTWRSPFLQNDKSTQMRHLIDLRGLATVPRSIKIGFTQPLNTNSSQGADVNGVKLFFPEQKLSLAAEQTDRLTVRQGSVQVWQAAGQPLTPEGALGGQADPAQSPPGRLLTGGLQLYTNLSPDQDWTGVETLALQVSTPANVSGLRLRLGLRSDSVTYWTQPLDTLLEPGWGLADLRELAPDLDNVDRVIIEILDDVLIEGLQEGGDAAVFTVGELRSPGNLATGRRYWYRLVEIDDASDTNVLNTIESEGSGAILEATPSYHQRRIALRLPTTTNASATHLALYRFGGGLIEDSSGAQPLGRLIGIIEVGASTFAYGGHTATGAAPHERAPANPYLAYTAGTPNVLVDNTPDSWLFGAEVFKIGREKPPATPSSVAVWNRRVWLSTASELFGSWLVDMQQPAALYWSRINLPEAQDPHASEKGFWLRLPLLAGDSIVRLWPTEQALLIFCERGVWQLSGSDFTDYRLDQVSPFGLAAAHGICEHQGTLYWLTHNGLMKWGQGQPDERIRLSLPPLSGATASAFALSSLISTPNELLACVPTNGSSTTPDTVLCLGVRSGAWTKWPGLSLAGGAARPETPVAAVGTHGGQIALLTLGAGDGSGTTDINPRVDTRYLGSREVSLRPHHLSIDGDLGAGESLALTVTGDDPAEAATRTYQFNPRATARFRVSRCPEGRSLVLSVTSATYGTFRLRRLGIEATPFSRRNT